MKKFLLMLVVLGATQPGFSQATLKITSGTSIKALNSVHIVSNGMRIQNDAIIQQGANDAIFDFIGDISDTIYGSGNTTISNIQLAKTGNGQLALLQNVAVRTQLKFISGLLNLGNSSLDLGSQGVLVNESDLSRAYTSGIGYIQVTTNLNAPNSVNPGNLGAVLTSASNLGSTIIRRGHAAQLNVYGPTSSIKRYYDIIPTNNKSLGAMLRFQYFDAELNGVSEPGLALWKSNNNSTGWATLAYTSKDMASNYVEKKGIPSFSRMTLAQGCSVISSSIPNVYAVSPGGAPNTLYLGYGPTALTLTCNVSGGVPPYSYNWASGQTSQSITVNPNVAGTYSYAVSVMDAYGCTGASTGITINVVDVRCGTKLDKVTVCVFNKGSYTTNCILSNSVSGNLANGSYLGPCGTPPPTAKVSNENGIEVSKAIADNFSIKVSPNPSSSYFILKVINHYLKEPATLRLINVLGNVVQVIPNVYSGQTLQIGHNLKPGTYFLEATQGTAKKLIKLIKL